jgi:hypothetical protein
MQSEVREEQTQPPLTLQKSKSGRPRLVSDIDLENNEPLMFADQTFELNKATSKDDQAILQSRPEHFFNEKDMFEQKLVE